MATYFQFVKDSDADVSGQMIVIGVWGHATKPLW